MKTPFKLAGEEVSLPTSWGEVSTSMFFKLRKWDGDDFIKFLSIVTGLKYDLLFKLRQAEVDDKLMPYLDWWDDKIKWDGLKPPKKIRFDGTRYNARIKPEEEPFGKKVMLQQAITKSKGGLVSNIPTAVSIYMCDYVTGEDFTKALADKFRPQVMKASIMDVYPLGAFFLKTLLASSKKRASASRANTPPNKQPPK